MIKKINTQHMIFYMFMILFIGYGLGLAFINIFNYGGAINNTLQTTSFMMIIPLVVLKKTELYSRRVVVILVIVLALLLFGFMMSRPDWTYSEAQDKVVEDYKNQSKEVEFVKTKKDSERSEEPFSFIVDKYFYLEFNIDKTAHYVLFNPVDGEYEVNLK